MTKNFHSRFLLLGLWWLALYWTFSRAWPRPFDDWKNSLLYVGGGLFCLYQLWHRRKEPTFRFNLPVLFLFLYLVVSLFSLQRPLYEGWLAFARLILWVGIVWMLTQLERGELWALAKIGLFSAALIAIGSLLQLGGVRLWPPYPLHFVPPIGYVVYYGEFMALHIPIALFFSLRSVGSRSKIFYGILFFLLLGGIAVSTARASLLAVFVGLGLVAAMKPTLRACLLLLVVPLVILAIPIGFRGSMLSRFALISHESGVSLPSKMISPRAIPYSKAYEMVKKRPLRGWGLGSFRFNYPTVAWRGDYVDHQFNASTWVTHPHNEFLHQAVEIGVPGVVLFALFWFSVFFTGIRRLLSTDAVDKPALLAGLVGILIVGVTWQLGTNFLFPLSRLLAGFYVAIVWKEISPPRLPFFLIRRGGGWGERSVVIALVAMVLLVTLFMTAYQFSLYATVKAQRSRSETERVQWIERGYRSAPGAIDPLLLAVADGVHGVPIPNLDKKARLLGDQYPEVPMALYFLAMYEMQRNRIDRAIGHLQHALLRYRNFSEAKDLLKGVTSESRSQGKK